MTSCAEPRVIYAGTIDYLDVPITSEVELGTQTVEFSLDDRQTWHAATWTGDPGTTRTASLLLDDTTTPAPAGQRVEILVRVDFGTTKPIVSAGTIVVR